MVALEDAVEVLDRRNRPNPNLSSAGGCSRTTKLVFEERMYLVLFMTGLYCTNRPCVLRITYGFSIHLLVCRP